jgi:LacI family transcriptional regulator
MDTPGRAPRIRLKQLAFELGLSQTTVSRALAGYADVSRDTRRRVVAAAQRCGYLDARLASRPRVPDSGFVGMLLPVGGGHAFDRGFVAALAGGLVRYGRDLFLATVPAGRDDLAILRHLVESRRVDAMVLRRSGEDDARVRLLRDEAFPFVEIADGDDGDAVADLIVRRLDGTAAALAEPRCAA